MHFSRFPRLTPGVILSLVTVFIALDINPATAQELFDWREKLACSADQQVFEGLLNCTGKDESGATVHVLVADLQSNSLMFEYILPKGLNDHDPASATPEPCRDVNVPAWGGTFGEGCFKPRYPNLYPVMSLGQAAERALEIRADRPLAAVIDADYGAPDQTHGPEGLTVVQGVRLDGAARCDDDFNAALRPWLGLGEGIDPATGQIAATIQRLQSDSAPLPPWLYTGIGGGPWLIRDGQAVPGSNTCTGEVILNQLPPIENCYDNPKSKTPPLRESYNGGSCRQAPHTAAGLSADGRWLFLVLTTSNRDPGTITRFMLTQLGVWQALKFDGGGSTQMLYNAPSPISIDPTGVERELSNFLGVYAVDGHGIRLPLGAEPVERVYYQVITGEETASFQLQVRNSGPLTWKPEDGVILREEPWFLITPIVEQLYLTGPVRPGETVSWNWEINTDNFVIRRFQMYQRDEPFGLELAVIVIHLPEEWADRREEFEQRLQELIDEWRARGEESLERLLDQIQEWITRELGRWLARLVSRLCQAIVRTMQELCNRLCLGFGLPALFILFVRRRHRRVVSRRG